MKDLEAVIGLPISVDPRTGRLTFRGELPAVDPAVRSLADMRDVLMNPDAHGAAEQYYMYRDVGFAADRERLHNQGVRYDITVIPPGRVGHEFAKTAGHYHPLAPGATVTFPEVYEVVHGTAHYLIQSAAEPYDTVDDVAILEVHAGEKVIIPPGYGHVTINLGSQVLVMTNLVEKDFKSIYGPYRDRRGAAYYCIQDEDHEAAFLENEHYDEVADPRMLPVEERPEAGLRDGVPLYRAAVADPARFSYLVRPQAHLALMALPELDEEDEEDED